MILDSVVKLTAYISVWKRHFNFMFNTKDKFLEKKSDKKYRSYTAGLILLMIFIISLNIKAQDLEPRSLSPAPVGMNFLMFGYAYSQGNILLDPALPIEGLEAKIHTLAGVYVQTINFFGLPGKVDVIIPYSFGRWTGEVYDADSSVSRSGFGDPMFRLSVNIIGESAQEPANFAENQSPFNVALAFRIRAPLGQYDDAKLINLGTNRWMIKPSLGMSYNIKRWTFEFHLGSWLFTANNAFWNGNQLKQDPMYSGQLHVIYSFQAGFWGAVSYGLVTGGRTTLNGNYKDDEQLSEKIGAVLIFPLSQNHSIKLGYSSGISARYGAKFDSYALTYQYRWIN